MSRKCVNCGNAEVKEYKDLNKQKIYHCKQCGYWSADFKRSRYNIVFYTLLFVMSILTYTMYVLF